MTENNKRVTVDFDSKSYYLDGEYWESWDNYGEEMADAINKLLGELNDENKELKFEIQNLRAVLRNIYNIAKENGDISRLRLALEFEEHINNKWWKND